MSDALYRFAKGVSGLERTFIHDTLLTQAHEPHEPHDDGALEPGGTFTLVYNGDEHQVDAVERLADGRLVLRLAHGIRCVMRVGEGMPEMVPPISEVMSETEPRGQYLCEVCFDTMTDTVLPASESPTGMEMAQCLACARQKEA
jgi:hypothetical protein